MASCTGLHVVSNGPQTMMLMDCGREGDLASSLANVTMEAPGDPHSPRITGATDLLGASPTHLLCAVTTRMRSTDRLVSAYPCERLPPGFGYCVTTYAGQSTEPLPFGSKPYMLSIRGLRKNLVDLLWASMPSDLRVGVLTKEIDLATGVVSTRWRCRGL